MRLKRIAGSAVLVAAVAAAAPIAAQANEVTRWNQIAGNTLRALALPSGGAPPALNINMAMTQGAVYDAVNSIEPRRRPYLLQTRFDPLASKDLAVATAAYRVLYNILSAPAVNPPRPDLVQTVQTEYSSELPLIPNASEAAGIAAGNAAADAMLIARANDGRFGPSAWVPNNGIGHWQPLVDPITQLPGLDPTPWAGNVKPFLLKSSSQFLTDGPNALKSAAYAKDLNEVKALGSVNSTERTPEQTHNAIFWQSGGGPALLWNPVARTLAGDANLDLGDSALLFAMMNMSAADAGISTWYEKYYWDLWRPWTAIQQADNDGNPKTEADPSWTALLTAPYPEHPSGHLSGDGSALRVLQMFFGDKTEFDVTSTRFPESRHFDRFSRALKEIIDARVWAGLHFRTADVQAQVLGKKVVHYMRHHYFQPLD
jgi:hypothetical protein